MNAHPVLPGAPPLFVLIMSGLPWGSGVLGFVDALGRILYTVFNDNKGRQTIAPILKGAPEVACSTSKLRKPRHRQTACGAGLTSDKER
ncbi:MAG: hypothetical protein HLUCCA12_14445 [Rhodobacteraceae bacterium HLUCCA12]|nr:MAG: hypothetical protein HLUCCA12_14445 [Rhodobacteraceae bacterium HLUCCA12]